MWRFIFSAYIKGLHGLKNDPWPVIKNQNWARTARHGEHILETASPQPAGWLIRIAARTAKKFHFEINASKYFCFKSNARNYFFYQNLSVFPYKNKISSTFTVFHLFTFTPMLSTISMTSDSLSNEPESHMITRTKTIIIAKTNHRKLKLKMQPRNNSRIMARHPAQNATRWYIPLYDRLLLRLL